MVGSECTVADKELHATGVDEPQALFEIRGCVRGRGVFGRV